MFSVGILMCWLLPDTYRKFIWLLMQMCRHYKTRSPYQHAANLVAVGNFADDFRPLPAIGHLDKGQVSLIERWLVKLLAPVASLHGVATVREP